jgi:putative endonuclease
MDSQSYWVYIMGGNGRTIYTGITNDLMRRVWEHKTKATRGFTSKYNLDRLLFYAKFDHPREAIAYEKKIKGWVRRKKGALIEKFNPDWSDLAVDWFPTQGDSSVA